MGGPWSGVPSLPTGGTAQQPPTLADIGAYIPPVRVPATFGTYPGPTRNPIGTGALPSAQAMVASIPNGERRRAVVRQARHVAVTAVARASTTARAVAGALPRPLSGRASV